jgi:ABC-type antimicrobial peptide transport system permease subunit
VVAALTAFLIAVLLTLSSVGKRVREIGTLKALGWKQSTVVRQVVGGLVVAVLGGLVAGAAGGWRAARMRPADALRQVE